MLPSAYKKWSRHATYWTKNVFVCLLDELQELSLVQLTAIVCIILLPNCVCIIAEPNVHSAVSSRLIQPFVSTGSLLLDFTLEICMVFQLMRFYDGHEKLYFDHFIFLNLELGCTVVRDGKLYFHLLPLQIDVFWHIEHGLRQWINLAHWILAEKLHLEHLFLSCPLLCADVELRGL